jgi:hypothetical protein
VRVVVYSNLQLLLYFNQFFSQKQPKFKKIMKGKFLKGFILTILGLMFCASALAQDKSTTEKVASLAGKTAIIVVGQTAKIAYKTTKFAAKEIVLPTAKVALKEIVLKAAPKVSLFMLKETGKLAEKSVPIGLKLIEKYLKYRLTL